MTGAEPRIRVLHAITLLELGGAQQNTLHSVRHLDRRRYEVGLVAGKGGLLDAEAEAIPDLERFWIPELRREVRPLDDARALAALVRLMRARRPHIVHTHSSKAGILGRIAARAAGVPIVVHSIHGFGFTPGQPAAVRQAFFLVEKAVAGLTSSFIAVSRANITEGVRRGLFPLEQVTLIRSGIPLDEFAGAPEDPAALRRELGFAEDAPLVGSVSCLKPQKDPLTFAEVAARVLKVEPRARFVLAGDGELRGALEARLRQLEIHGAVRLLGWRNDVPRLLKGIDVLLHTSRWEGLPRVLPQAMAAGVPAVATAVDGAPEAVHHAVSGFLAEPGDAAALADYVLRLLAEPELRRRMAAAGRERVAEFDAALLVPAQEALYEQLFRRVA